MKFLKSLLLSLVLMCSACLASCTTKEVEKVSLITPTGAPSLAIGDALLNSTYLEPEIVSGSDGLVAAFTNESHDIVVAPVNLGAKFYNTNENFGYVFYKTIVWGNYYLASTSEIESFESLEGKTLLVFGKNSTPDVVVRTLIASKEMNVTLEYVDDVATANSYLLTGKADIIVSAEPSITKVSSKKTIYTYDLQKEWQELTGSYSFPQAGIFVRKAVKDEFNVRKALTALTDSVKLVQTNPNQLVASAVQIDSSLASIGEAVLQKAVLKCNLKLDDAQKDAINYYFSKVIELGIGKTVGGKLPDEGFYY